ncbi:MAG: U32 family peptidase [Prevotella sp.]|nr:U32 family peptidase [Prevotella sp.]MBQ9561485.1 U32 family peptidase [Prevotella sp.]
MAPVGSRESLAAAINAGADSIYFGIEKLNMRAHSASTFTIEDLKEIAALTAEHGIKSYLTVNTIIYGEDIEQMHEIIDAAKEANISAVIASDVAVMMYCKQVGQEVHLSTQLNISNIEALRFYAQFADVVVLARELRMDQVKAIHEQAVRENICGPSGNPIRIEMFCHGALCMAISGKCYLSLQLANRSANRGECVQICRRGYKVDVNDATQYIATDVETGHELMVENKYIMSPKDLKTIRFIDKMMDAGVRVFKIEGRARGPEYVDTVVRCYKEAIKAVIDDRNANDNKAFSEEAKDAWDERLSRVFNRGFWNGYYQGQTIGEWNDSYGSKATEKKVYAAKTIKYFSKIGVAEFQVEAHEIKVGDKLLITGTTTGAMYIDEVKEIRYDLKPVDVAEKGQRISIAVPGKVRPNDKLFVLERL